MTKSPQSHQGKEESGFWWLNPASKSESVLLSLLFLFLPTQLGKHFWPSFSLVSGIRVDYLSPTLYVTDILVGLLIFVWVFNLRHSGKPKAHPESLIAITDSGQTRMTKRIIRFGKKHWLMLIVLVLFIVNVLNSARLPLSLYFLLKLFEFFFLAFYIAQTIQTEKQLRHIGFLFTISAFLESLLAISQYINQASLNGLFYFLGERAFNGSTPGIANASVDGTLILRPYGTFSHPNVLAAFLLLASVSITAFYVLKTKGWSKRFGMATLVVMSIALVLTLSRAALGVWFLLVCSLLVWKVLRIRTYRNGMIFAIVVGSLISIIMLPFFHTVLTRFAETSMNEEAVLQRTVLLIDALKMIQTHPLFGVGIGQFIPTLAPMQEPLSIGLYLQPVHNIFLLVASETGLIGVGLFIGFLTLTYRRIWRQMQTTIFKKEYLVFGILLSSVLVLGMFDHFFLTLQQGQLVFAFVIGLCWARLSE